MNACRRLAGALGNGLLALYARLQRPAIRLNYAIVRCRLVLWPPARAVVGRLVLAPLSAWGASGQPLLPGEAEQLIHAAARRGPLVLGPCGCRGVHHGCSHPVETELLLGAGAAVFRAAHAAAYREVEEADALALLADCRRHDMIQVLYRSNMAGGVEYSICNCCSDGCLPLLNRQVYPAYRFDAGRFVASVDSVRCAGCGTCRRVCPFGLDPAGSLGRVAGCLGCGLCGERCPHNAIRMELRGAVGR